MNVAVVTSFSAAGFEQYGCRFIETFAEHWPSGVDLIVYQEANFVAPRALKRNLFHVAECRRFIAANGSDAMARGMAPTPVWKDKDRRDGYSFKTDAVKFCRKVFAVADAAKRMQKGILVWLDADTYTHAPVPTGFLEGILGDADAAYLGRDHTHSECGFVAFRLPQAAPLIEAWEAFYATDSVFNQREFHDSYLFDRAREKVAGNWRNLTPGGKGHVWVNSPLNAYLDHCKGERKSLGYSPERFRHV